MITHVSMIILLEHNLDAAVDFYKKLGLKLVFHVKESWAEFAIGSVKLGLCPTPKAAHDRVTGFVLEVDDLYALYASLKDQIAFKSAPIEKVHGIMASIQDPGGNIVDLYQPTPDKVQKLVKEVVQKEGLAEGKKPCNPATCGCKAGKIDA